MEIILGTIFDFLEGIDLFSECMNIEGMRKPNQTRIKKSRPWFSMMFFLKQVASHFYMERPKLLGIEN